MNSDLSIVLGNVIGPELLIVLGLVVVLFGGSQIPKLARSLGQAQKEFKAGQAESGDKDGKEEDGKEADGSSPSGDERPPKV